MDWIAKWIWDEGEAHPRNRWLCFRKCFLVSGCISEALFHVTADSRYIAYINGSFIGMGPVRSWPSEQFYDSYNIKELLRDGENVIAILVTHYGVSNFQYIEGRGGLFAQLEILSGTDWEIIGTDDSWKAHTHMGYMRSSERICCQQAWTEIHDANAMDENWKNNGYDDTEWRSARIIGSYGAEPWTRLQKRDIPFLREEQVYPDRVETIREVELTGRAISLDLQPNLFPGETDSNPKEFIGYIACIIHAAEDMKGSIRFPWDKWVSTYGSFRINDKVYRVDEGRRKVVIELCVGENFFLMDVGGKTHLPTVLFHINTPKPVRFLAPGYHNAEFVTVGPFEHKSIVNAEAAENNEVDMNNITYKAIWETYGWKTLIDGFGAWIKPVLMDHMCEDNVFMPFVYSNVLKTIDVPYEAQNMAIPNQEYSLLQPCRNSDTEIILAFKKEVTGFIEFEIDAPKGTIIDFYGVENIKPGFEIEHTEGVNCTLRYIAREGRQRYRSFVRRGFHYLLVALRRAACPVKFYRVFVNQSTFPVADVGAFECSDWKLNRIWEISKHTTKLCMEDTYVDCPAYEQAFWVGDARNASLVNYYTFGAYDICRHSLRLVAASTDRSPLPESQVPSGWQNILPAWAFFWINACREYYEYTADLKFLQEIYPALVKALKGFMERLDHTGLFYSNTWNLLEWAPMDMPEKGIMAHQNAGLVKALSDVAEIAQRLDKVDESKEYICRADEIKAAINKYLWDEEAQAFIDCIHENGERSGIFSMQTNVMVYLCECVEGERKAKLEQHLVSPPDKFVKIINPFMLFFYFEALTRLGMAEEIVNTVSREWGRMIDYGSTTCWETFERFDMDINTRSYCHAWSAAPGYFLGLLILGVRCLKPGFARVLIDPKPCGLKWARGSVPVPGGRIDVRWENQEGRIKVRVNGPKWIEYVCGGSNVEIEYLP